MKTQGAGLMRRLAKMIKNKIPKEFGFVILIFPFNQPGVANYISNAERSTMILALEEKIKILKQKGDFPTPEEN